MWLTVTRGEGLGRSVEVGEATATIGRDPSCDIIVPDPRVSRRHAIVQRRAGGGIEVVDLSSANGTFLDGQRLTQPAELRAGQRIQVGDTELRVDPVRPGAEPTRIGASPSAAATPPIPPPPGAAGAGTPPPPPPPPPPGSVSGATSGSSSGRPSTEILRLRRSLRRTTMIGIAAIVAVVIIGGVVAAILLTGGDDDDAPATVAEIVEQARPSTVNVTAEIGNEAQGGGTGWVYDAEQGLIVTNAHVVNAGDTFEVNLDDETPQVAELVGVAPCDDLAVLRVEDTEGLRTLPLGSQADLQQGETVVAVGFPGSASTEGNLTATSGVVSVVQERFDLEGIDVPQYPNVIQTDTAINPGNSGGPLIDLEGDLVGVNSAGITLLGERTIQGQGYAIGVDRVKEIVPELAEGNSIDWTGMGFVFPTADDAQALIDAGLPAQPGIVVTHAVPGSPADEAGFGADPVLIVGVNGEPIDGSLPSYCRATDDTRAGDSITFTVFTPGSSEPQDVSLTVPSAG